MRSDVRKIVLSALMAALTCVATMIIKIPSPMKGYLNLGDCVVLTAGWMLPPCWGFLAAGLGSALADLFLGYPVYVPATFLIKGSMAVVAFYGFHLLRKKFPALPCRIMSGTAAEILMILGYFMFGGFLYGFAGAATNIPGNAVQGIAGLIIGIVLIKVLENSKMMVEKG